MQEPSDQWKKLRRAALERARRKAIEPLEPLYQALFCTSALYLLGFLRISFMEQPSEFSFIGGALIFIVAMAGFLLLVLSGSALTLFIANKELDRLIDE